MKKSGRTRKHRSCFIAIVQLEWLGWPSLASWPRTAGKRTGTTSTKYYWSRRSTADPAVQYYSISCWERPTARPNNYKGDQNPPLGPLQRPFKGQKPLHSVFKTFKINFDLVNFSPKSSLLWLLEVRFEFGHWYAEERKDWRIFVTFTRHPKTASKYFMKIILVEDC